MADETANMRRCFTRASSTLIWVIRRPGPVLTTVAPGQVLADVKDEIALAAARGSTLIQALDHLQTEDVG